MIGQHPQLAGLPELKLFCCGSIGELASTLPKYWASRGVTHRSPGLVRAVAQLEFGGQRLDDLAASRRWLEERAHWAGADVLDRLMLRSHPRTAVEKSPENVGSDASLERLATAYPAARYLHLTRHPVATQRSMEQHARRMIPGIVPRGEPMAGIAMWFEVHRRIMAFTASLPGDRCLRVRAEDVLNDAGASLGGIARWLGVRTDTSAIEAMRHPEMSLFARAGPAGSGVAGGHDPGFLADPRMRGVELPGSLAPPPGWTADASDWAIVTDLARQLGYRNGV